MNKSLNYFMYSLLVSFLLFGSCEKSHETSVSEKGSLVTLENEHVSLVFDYSVGTYSISDKSSGDKPISDAKLKSYYKKNCPTYRIIVSKDMIYH